MTGSTDDQPTGTAPVVVLPREIAPPLKLDDKEQEVGDVTPAVTKARVFGLYADTWARMIMVLVIALIFVGLNWAVMGLLRDAFVSDLKFLAEKPPTIKPMERVITTQLLMALIGATVVQVGVAIIAIVSYLFPKTRGDAGKDN